MAGKIKGIQVEISGNTEPLEKALKDVNKESRNLTKELADVERGLKFSPGNSTLLAQQQEILAEKVQNSATKLDVLRQAQGEVERQFSAGEIDNGTYRQFRREVEKTEGILENLQTKLRETGTRAEKTETSMDKLKRSFRETKDEAKKLAKETGKGLGAAGAAGAAGIGALVTGSQDYNQALARLRTNASTAGADLGLVEDAFSQVTSVTGDADSAVETISNLLASGFNDEQLSGILEEITGSYIKFSDTLSTEGVADGLQETLAGGEAIGQFAELLERSGVSVEDFNAGLADAQAKGEGTNYALQQLSELGLSDTLDKYKEMNPEVQANAEATANMQKAAADLAVALTPLVVFITDLVTQIAEWAAKNPELAATVGAVAGVIAGLAGTFVVLTPIVKGIMALWPVLAAAFGAISAPVAIAVAAIAGLVAAGVLIYKNWDEISAYAQEAWSKIKDWVVQGVTTAVSWIVTKWTEAVAMSKALLSVVVSTVVEKFTSIVTNISQKMQAAKNWISNKFTEAKNSAVQLMANIVSSVIEKFTSVVTNVRNKMTEAKNKVSEIWENVKTLTSTALETVVRFVTTRFTRLVAAVREKMNDAKNKIKEIWAQIKEFFAGIDLFQTGKDVIMGLVNGIGSVARRAAEKAKEVAEGVVGAVKGLFRTASPSKVMIGVGGDVGEGLVIGLDSMVRKASTMAEKLASAAMPELGAVRNVETVRETIQYAGQNMNAARSINNEPRQPLIVQSILNSRVIAEEIYHDIDHLLGRKSSINNIFRGIKG